MEHGPLRALALDINLQVHGVPVTVMPDDAGLIETRGIWLAGFGGDPAGTPAGFGASRPDRTYVLVLSRAAVTQALPRGTRVLAPEQSGGTERSWRVAETERIDANVQYVVLQPEQWGES